MECPKCGSTRVIKAGFNITKTGRRQRYHCYNGHIFYRTRETSSGSEASDKPIAKRYTRY